MFANRTICGIVVPCVVFYILAVMFIVIYGIILRATRGRDFLARKIYSHPIMQDIDGWSVTHFLFFGLLGVLYPGQHLQFFLVGYGWEVIETLLGQYKFGTTGKRLQLIGDQDADGNMTGNDNAYWYGKESDVIADVFGYCLGSSLAERFWPNTKISPIERGRCPISAGRRDPIRPVAIATPPALADLHVLTAPPPRMMAWLAAA